MKRSFLTSLVLIALFVTMVPGTVFAAAPADVIVFIRNQTGGQVNLSLTLPGGFPIYKTLDAGTSQFGITEGTYTYYASTPCGNSSGQWNLTVNKTLLLSCNSGSPTASLTRINGCTVGVYESAFNMWENWTIWQDYLREAIYEYDGTIITDAQSYVDYTNITFPWVHASLICFDKKSMAKR